MSELVLFYSVQGDPSPLRPNTGDPSQVPTVAAGPHHILVCTSPKYQQAQEREGHSLPT